jgi:hypothetical protein
LAGFAVPLARNVPEIKQPLWHAAALQISPLPQLVPFAIAVQAVVDVPGWQLWQTFRGLTAPAARTAPSMKQPSSQETALQTFPLPQLVPSASAVHAPVDVAGWQRWQLFDELSVFAATNAPAM